MYENCIQLNMAREIAYEDIIQQIIMDIALLNDMPIFGYL